ncbi:MAG: hypothetical protein MK081_15605 [Flavobacteriales bacterium]|nr:hypothetical protein [Flavobacteriales bacterium]
MYRSLRKKGWDYGQTATYMITICTNYKQPFFGRIENGEVVLSKAGLIAKQRWEAAPSIYPNVAIGAFIIMPDHVHLIVYFERVLHPKDSGTGKFGPQSMTLGRVIAGYKASVTSRVKPFNPRFKWQERYDDQILRSESAIQRAANYIHNNPKNVI